MFVSLYDCCCCRLDGFCFFFFSFVPVRLSFCVVVASVSVVAIAIVVCQVKNICFYYFESRLCVIFFPVFSVDSVLAFGRLPFYYCHTA